MQSSPQSKEEIKMIDNEEMIIQTQIDEINQQLADLNKQKEQLVNQVQIKKTTYELEMMVENEAKLLPLEKPLFKDLQTQIIVAIENSLNEIVTGIILEQSDISEAIGSEKINQIKQKTTAIVSDSKNNIEELTSILTIDNLLLLLKNYDDEEASFEADPEDIRGTYELDDVMAFIAFVIGKQIGLIAPLLINFDYDLNHREYDDTWYNYNNEYIDYLYTGLEEKKLRAVSAFDSFQKYFYNRSRFPEKIKRLTDQKSKLAIRLLWEAAD